MWLCAGTKPLAASSIIDLTTLQQLPATATGDSPGPRGQPTAVVTSDDQTIIFFGGWDGVHRYNDLHTLDVQVWMTALMSGCMWALVLKLVTTRLQDVITRV